jgi:CheY-like chemotaxis protein
MKEFVYKVLVVGRNPSFLEPIVTKLELNGFEVLVARSAQQCWDIFKNHPDIQSIVMDYEIPSNSKQQPDKTGEVVRNLIRELRVYYTESIIAASKAHNAELLKAGCTNTWKEQKTSSV